MEKWCYVVSDYCREACPVAVFNGPVLLSNFYLDPLQELIEAFLCKHEDYKLRFITRREEIDKLGAEGYSFLNDFTEEKKQEYIKKYKINS